MNRLDALPPGWCLSYRLLIVENESCHTHEYRRQDDDDEEVLA